MASCKERFSLLSVCSVLHCSVFRGEDALCDITSQENLAPDVAKVVILLTKRDNLALVLGIFPSSSENIIARMVGWVSDFFDWFFSGSSLIIKESPLS